MRARVLIAAAIACIGISAPLAAQDSSALTVQLEATLGDFHARYGFPSATAAIALPDGTVAVAAVGLADVESVRAMTPLTRMLAASIGKTFVAATVLALESEGAVSQRTCWPIISGIAPGLPTCPMPRR